MRCKAHSCEKWASYWTSLSGNSVSLPILTVGYPVIHDRKFSCIAQLVRNNVHVRLFMYTTGCDFVASLDLTENIKRIRYRYSRYIPALYIFRVCWICFSLSRPALEGVSGNFVKNMLKNSEWSSRKSRVFCIASRWIFRIYWTRMMRCLNVINIIHIKLIN